MTTGRDGGFGRISADFSTCRLLEPSTGRIELPRTFPGVVQRSVDMEGYDFARRIA
ncbi:MAG: hypothetical protein ACJ71Y_04410 [Blastococcus sp.]